jgi:SPW repeat
MVWQNVINALIGIWFIIAPAVLPFPNDVAMAWTSVIGGVILLVLAGSAASIKGGADKFGSRS